MRILVAPDSFKGSLKSTEVASWLKGYRGWIKAGWWWSDLWLMEEGTVEVLVQGTGVK